MNFSDYARDYLKSQFFATQGTVQSVYGLSINSFMLVMAQNLHKHRDRDVKFHLGFLSNHGRNAYADEVLGEFYLSMHTDMFQGFLQFSNFCFSQAGFLSSVGDAAKETSPAADEGFAQGLGLFTSKRAVFPDKVVISGRQMPLCTTRAIAAIHMGHLMARFVWLHEFAHCFRNHIKYIRSNRLGDRLSEALPAIGAAGFPVEENLANHSETYQALEVDADYWAMEAMLRVQLGGTEPIKMLAKKHINHRFTLTLFAIVSICWMFEEYHKGLSDPHHPPTDLRQILMMFHVSRFIKQHCPDAMLLLTNVYKQFEVVRSVIPGFHDIRSLHKQVYSNDLRKRVNEKFGNLKAIRAELATFT